MKIKDALRLIEYFSKNTILNEGFYAYHCTRADLEDFTDEEHNNVTSGNGAAQGIGAYFEVLDKDANAEEYLSDIRANGKQYKVYIDLSENQILDIEKSFKENGKMLSVEDYKEFLKLRNGRGPSDYFNRLVTDFNTKFKSFYKSAKPEILSKFYDLMVETNSKINLINNNSSVVKLKYFINAEDLKKLRLAANLYTFASRLGIKSISDLKAKYTKEQKTEILEQIFSVESYILEKGDFIGLYEMAYNIAPRTKNIPLFLFNLLPIKFVMESHTQKEDIRWIRKHFDVWGKFVNALNKNGKKCRHLILWKTKGITRILGKRHRYDNKLDKQFTDEIEDDKEQDMISRMLDYSN